MKLYKKLMVLIIILSPISRSFSQTDTKVKNDTIVGLSQPVARLVIKDLINYDGLKLENQKLMEIVDIKQKETTLLEEKVSLGQNKISNLESMVSVVEQKFSLESNKSKELENINKKQKKRTLLFQITTFIATVAAVVFFVK